MHNAHPVSTKFWLTLAKSLCNKRLMICKGITARLTKKVATKHPQTVSNQHFTIYISMQYFDKLS